MQASLRTEAATTVLLALTVPAVALLPIAVLNPAHLALFSDRAWIIVPMVFLPTIALARAAKRGWPLSRKPARVILACGSVLSGLLTVALGLLLALGALLDSTDVRATITGSTRVDVEHITGRQGLGPDMCQQIDLRRGSGLLARHRIATTCSEVHGQPWQIDLAGDQLSLTSTFQPRTCRYRIDTAHLTLTPISTDRVCREIIL